MGAGRHYPRGVHPGTHSGVGEVSIVVSPRFSYNSGTACGAGRSAWSEPLPSCRSRIDAWMTKWTFRHILLKREHGRSQR